MAAKRLRFVNGMRLEVPFFEEYLPENGGCLPPDFEAHALWHYYVMARMAYEQIVQGGIPLYEGELDAKFQPERIFKSTMMLHGVDGEKAVNYWSAVHAQRFMLGLSSNADLPQRYEFRGGGKVGN